MAMASETRAETGVAEALAGQAEAPARRGLRDRPELFLSCGFLLVALALWEGLSRLGVLHEIILPAPSQILEGIWTVVTLEGFPWEIGTTLLEVFVGFLLAVVLGVGIGIITGTFELFRKSIYPYIVAFQVIPKVVFAPIFLAWFGYGITSKIVMAAVIAFFPCLINTAVGLKATSEDEVMLMRSYVATRKQIFFKLTLPKALPFIFAGIKTALTFALIGAIVAEFIGTYHGLGLMIQTFNFALQMPLMFAVIFIISATGIVLYIALDYVDRKIVFWRREEII
jgi:NitT/TauT family transport system permease protein